MTGFSIIYTGAPPQDPKSMHGIAEDNRKAREAGLTYGQWAALHNQDIEPRKEADTSDAYSIAAIQAFLDIYNTGLNDPGIARAFNWSVSKVRFRRANIYRLPANVTQGHKTIKRESVTVDDVLKQIKHPYEGRKKKGGRDEQAGNVPQKLRHDAAPDGREIAGR